MFQGSIVALITPFRQGQLDEAALARLVEWHIEQGTHGIVPVGTTGESPTVKAAEREEIIKFALKTAAAKRPRRAPSPIASVIRAALRPFCGNSAGLANGSA